MTDTLNPRPAPSPWLRLPALDRLVSFLPAVIALALAALGRCAGALLTPLRAFAQARAGRWITWPNADRAQPVPSSMTQVVITEVFVSIIPAPHAGPITSRPGRGPP